MKEVTTLTQDDLISIETLPTGALTVPVGFKVYKVETAEEIRQQRIDELEAELGGVDEPSDAELLELGRETHPYFELKETLDTLQDGSR